MMTNEELVSIFSYHEPRDGEQVKKYQQIRAATLELARLINEVCPESREKSLAITSFQSAVMWANASIALHDK